MKSNKLIEITEGEYYLFFNFYKQKDKVTLGYPFKNSPRNDVFLSINEEERSRLTFAESNRYLNDAIKKILPLYDIKGISSVQTKTLPIKQLGFCNKCEKKLRGDITKDVCTECWRKHNKSKIKMGSPYVIAKTLKKTTLELSTTQNETYLLLKQGYSIKSIACTRGLKESTIVSHILKINESVSLSNFKKIKPKQEIIDRVEDAIDDFDGDYALKDIREHLDEEVDYDEIRLALIFMKGA